MLYDLTSVWMEGRSCPLARRGHSRDGKKGQAADRVRPAVQPGRLHGVGGGVRGNTADPATVGSQVAALRERFNLSKVVLWGTGGC